MTQNLSDGMAYNIHLKKGRTIYKAVYHHCALSDKHYFAKKEDVYPIEDVACHSMKGCDVNDDMEPQTLTGHYCGHYIRVDFTSVIPHGQLTQIPDSVYDHIMGQIKENITEGEFSEEETGDRICIANNAESSAHVEYTVTAGTWRIVQIDHKFMLRVAMWFYNYGHGEGLTKELFVGTYGQNMGEHYYSKWEHLYKHGILAMIAYFGISHRDGQKFCDMILKQMTAYETRTKNQRQ